MRPWAMLALYADTENLKIIKQAFPQIWECYAEMAKTDLIEFAAAELHEVNFQDTKPWPLGASPDHYLYNPTPPFRHCKCVRLRSSWG